jgi:hypothetical protein
VSQNEERGGASELTYIRIAMRVGGIARKKWHDSADKKVSSARAASYLPGNKPLHEKVTTK